MRPDGSACLRMGLSLLAAFLLAMCLASLAPSVAKAAEDVPDGEPMEADETEDAPDGMTAGAENATSEEPPATQMVFADGMAQPVFTYSDARAEGYTNANSELWRFCVYVESDYDTDLDGKCDLMKVYVQVPRAAVESGEGGWKTPVLYEARPYNGGMAMDLHGLLGFGMPELDDEELAQRPAKRVASSSMSTTQLALDTTRSNPQLWNYDIPKIGAQLPENYTFCLRSA